MKCEANRFPETKKKTKKKLEFNLIMTGLVVDHTRGEMNLEITGSVRHHMDIENELHFTFHGDERLEMQRAGYDLPVEIGVGNQPIRHQREREVEIPSGAGANLSGGDRNLTDVGAFEAEERAAVGVPESDAVRVPDGDGGVEADVEVDAESGDVDGEIEVGDGDGVDSDDGVLGLENGKCEDEDE